MWIFFIILLPPAIFALTNLIDKFLVSGDEEDSNPSVLMATGAFFNLLVSVPVLIFILLKGDFVFSGSLFLNGIIFSISIWIYLYLLSKEDVNRVVVWYQFIPVFGLIGGFIFLREFLSPFEIFGILLIVSGSLFLSFKKGKINKKFVCLALLSVLLLTVNDVVFAFYGREISVSNALFSDILGKGFFGFFFLLSSNVRLNFVKTIRTKFKVQSFNEIIFIVGDALFDVGKIYAPVAVVQAFAASQPVFVFIGDFFVKKLKPHFFKYKEKEKLDIKILIGILIVVFGGVLIGLSI